MNFADRLEISVEDLAALRADGSDLQLVDVREDWERALGTIPGSIEIALAALPDGLDRLDPRRPVVAVCHHGVRSLHAAAWLRRQGFAQAVSLKGGVDAWAARIDPAFARY